MVVILVLAALSTPLLAQPDLEDLRRRADEGYVRAQYNLALMYDTGRGVPEDNMEAVRWYRKAADQGNVRAQNNLGVMYDAGEGVPEDNAEAVRWYRMAAEQGDASAQYNLGVMYDTGEGVPEDDTAAVRRACAACAPAYPMSAASTVMNAASKATPFHPAATRGSTTADALSSARWTNCAFLNSRRNWGIAFEILFGFS